MALQEVIGLAVAYFYSLLSRLSCVGQPVSNNTTRQLQTIESVGDTPENAMTHDKHRSVLGLDARLLDECSDNHGSSDRWINKLCQQDTKIQYLEKEIRILHQEIMSMKCEVEEMRGAHQEVKDMLRVVRKFLNHFRPPEKASGSVISFFLSEGNTDKEIACFREFFSYFIPRERLK